MKDPKHPKPGDSIIDASDVKLADKTPEYILSLTKLRPGYKKAVANVERLTPAQIKAVGFDPDEVARVVSTCNDHEYMSELHEASSKLTEMLHESKLDNGHIIATLLAELAAQARRRADRAPNPADILGPLDDLLEYVSAPAVKAASTRAKNAKGNGQAQPANGQAQPANGQAQPAGSDSK